MKLEQPPKCSSQKESLEVSKLISSPDTYSEISEINAKYPYWDKVKYIKSTKVQNPQILWHALKFLRKINWTEVSFGNYHFSFTPTNEILQLLHYFDMNIGGSLTSEHLIPNDKKQTYLISSIMEEAIASSQIEGASTTRKVAKEMLRKSEKPQDKSQQMILNNYKTINHIKEIYKSGFSVSELLNIHHSMTENTLDDPNEAGKIRQNDDILVVDCSTSDVAFIPPHFEELSALLSDLENFFNNDSKNFIHPIIKGIIVHFMLAYIHPFVDGNGRTARSLFYWYMLKQGYWMVEYMSISRIIYKTKTAYEKSFLYTEYDENDLTYFILYNLKTMKQAFDDLKEYLKRKTEENKSSVMLSFIKGVNQRQAEIIMIVQENPNAVFSVKEIENRFSISNFTARADLENLVELGYLSEIQINKVKRSYIKSKKFDDLIKH
ncbi:MAG TPA: Fic family protein [Paludibacteraceae bacterium]|nr:Fic family protein [Paludibacteraceae bacterium]HQF49977.1 Fic family protein [Paludibacteraceae bacterium]HQJ89576.1 Fic family protein [Paludibacteraceae bacterium]